MHKQSHTQNNGRKQKKKKEKKRKKKSIALDTKNHPKTFFRFVGPTKAKTRQRMKDGMVSNALVVECRKWWFLGNCEGTTEKILEFQNRTQSLGRML